MKRDAPVAAIKIAAPVASVKKKKKNNFLFRQKDRLFFNFSSSIQQCVDMGKVGVAETTLYKVCRSFFQSNLLNTDERDKNMPTYYLCMKK